MAQHPLVRRGDTVAMLRLVADLGGLALALYIRFRGGAWRRFNLVEPGARA